MITYAKNISNIGDLLFDGLKIPYKGDWVVVPDHLIKSIGQAFDVERQKGNILIKEEEAYVGPSRKYDAPVAKTTIQTTVEVSNKISFIDETYVKDQFYKRLFMLNWKMLSKMIAEGYYDDLSILKEITSRSKSKVIHETIQARLDFLRGRADDAEKEDTGSN